MRTGGDRGRLGRPGPEPRRWPARQRAHHRRGRCLAGTARARRDRRPRHRDAGVRPAQPALRDLRLARPVPATAVPGLGHVGADHGPGHLVAVVLPGTGPGRRAGSPCRSPWPPRPSSTAPSLAPTPSGSRSQPGWPPPSRAGSSKPPRCARTWTPTWCPAGPAAATRGCPETTSCPRAPRSRWPRPSASPSTSSAPLTSSAAPAPTRTARTWPCTATAPRWSSRPTGRGRVDAAPHHLRAGGRR